MRSYFPDQWTHAPCNGSIESKSLDHQGSPRVMYFCAELDEEWTCMEGYDRLKCVRTGTKLREISKSCLLRILFSVLLFWRKRCCFPLIMGGYLSQEGFMGFMGGEGQSDLLGFAIFSNSSISKHSVCQGALLWGACPKPHQSTAGIFKISVFDMTCCLKLLKVTFLQEPNSISS